MLLHCQLVCQQGRRVVGKYRYYGEHPPVCLFNIGKYCMCCDGHSTIQISEWIYYESLYIIFKTNINIHLFQFFISSCSNRRNPSSWESMAYPPPIVNNIADDIKGRGISNANVSIFIYVYLACREKSTTAR